MSDARIIEHVTRDGDQVTVTLSDGASFHPGGYPAVGDPGDKRYLVALRDPQSATGELLADGPALTYDAALKFQAAGIADAEVLETIARGPDTTGATPAAAPTPTEVAEVAPPALVLSAADHARTKTLGQKIRDHVHAIGGDVAAAWHELELLLGHVHS